MSWLGEQGRRLRFWLQRSKLERELAEEMHQHREAALRAGRYFGNSTHMAEDSRAFWGWQWLDTTEQDLRYAVRQIRRSPGFAVVAVLTLAAGIGANTAVFTLFNAFILKPVPVAAPEQLVHVKHLDAQGRRQNLFSYLEFRDLQAQSRTLSGLAAYNKIALRPDTPPGGALPTMADSIGGLLITHEYFEVLGARPALGRLFTAAEDRGPSNSPVIVLGWRYWQRAYQGDPTVLGRMIRLQGQSFTVIGVTARGFLGPEPVAPEVYLPLTMRDVVLGPGSWAHGTWRFQREEHTVVVLGRLRPYLTMTQAQGELQSIAARWPQENSQGPGRRIGVAVRSAATLVDLDSDFVPLLAPVGMALGLVLLLCCANAANLFLARATARRFEIGVRLSLGAQRSRIVRQLVTEATVLALCSGMVGLLLALALVHGLFPIVLAQLPPIWRNTFQIDVSLDARVFAWTSGLSVLCGLLFGLAPALESVRRDVAAALKNEGSALGRHISGQRLRNTLLIAQVAISLVLLISASLLLRGLQRLSEIDAGFRPRGAVSFQVSLDGSGDPAKGHQRQWQLAERLRASGVQASLAWRNVLSGRPHTLQARLADGRSSEVFGNLVSAEYFQTLGYSLVRGRTFTRDEADGHAPVTVVTSSTAQQFWPGQDPLGQRITLHSTGGEEVPVRTVTVIGVLADTRSGLVWMPDSLFCFLPLSRLDSRSAYLFVQAGTTDQGVAATKREAAKLDPRLALTALPLEPALRMQLLPFQACAAFALVLGVLALAVASVGLYGVVSYLARQRTRELGIRIALGATHRQAVTPLLRQGLSSVAIGSLFGVAGGVVASRLLRAVLAGVSPLDPIAYAGVIALLSLVAWGALYLPARRAAQVDPAVVLRQG